MQETSPAHNFYNLELCGMKLRQMGPLMAFSFAIIKNGSVIA